jgi:hypothetical protein
MRPNSAFALPYTPPELLPAKKVDRVVRDTYVSILTYAVVC